MYLYIYKNFTFLLTNCFKVIIITVLYFISSCELSIKFMYMTVTLFSNFQVLTQGPHFYLFMKALKQKVPFKKVAKAFAEGHKLPELPKEKAVPAKTKKLKVGESTSSSNSFESTSNEDDNSEEIEDFQSSYVLTMSQMIPEKVEKNSNSADDSEYIFEAFTQVSLLHHYSLTTTVTIVLFLQQIMDYQIIEKLDN